MRTLQTFLAVAFTAASCIHPIGAFTTIHTGAPFSSTSRLFLPVLATLAPPSTTENSNSNSNSNSNNRETLSKLFPDFSDAISQLGISTPTPIQSASATLARQGGDLLLVAPTGSGKTLAYLLPALTKAMQEDGTVLICAPTRELAVQLLRDAVALLGRDNDDGIRLSVRGVEPAILDETATVLIGTPPELYEALKNEGGDFLSDLSAIVLDEVDVLLPPPSKTLRTALDENGGRVKTTIEERRKKEQKRKVMAAKRRGVQLDDDTKRILTETEQILGLVANSRLKRIPQILAGSATASRRTLDRLNQALRFASQGAAVPLGIQVQLCRPTMDSNPSDAASHTIRAVTVPSQIQHKYLQLDKSAASNPQLVMQAVVAAAEQLQPETSLLFLCGEFGKSPTAEKATPSPANTKGTVRRKSAARGLFAKADTKPKPKQQSHAHGLSARKACQLLNDMGIVAQPLHVALGLEQDAAIDDDDDDDDEIPPFLVTFEGSARGLHLEGIDVVFVVGRPSSAASYLHLAGRVGRASADEHGNVVVKPGTVVSICTQRSAKELEKWTQQIGGSGLEPILLGNLQEDDEDEDIEAEYPSGQEDLLLDEDPNFSM